MKYKQLLVPLDGSLLSEQVLPHAEELATTYASEIWPAARDFAERVRGGTDALSEGEPLRYFRYLERVEETLRNNDVKVIWSIRTGDPAEEIVWYVEEHEMDLVLMSTHGRGRGFQRTDGKIGSVAAEVLDEVPVFLARVPESIAKLWSGDEEPGRSHRRASCNSALETVAAVCKVWKNASWNGGGS